MELSVSLDPVSGKPELKSYVEELNKLENISIHLDVMDGHFVPRVSFPIDEYKFVVENSAHPIDVHLMIDDPTNNINKYLAKAIWGTIRSMSFHVETQDWESTQKLLKKIAFMGITPGIIVDLPTKLPKELPDLVTIMSVKCGASGQSFNESALDKVKQIKKINPNARIILDGGVNLELWDKVKSAGVHTAVMGSAVYKDRSIPHKLLNEH